MTHFLSGIPYHSEGLIIQCIYNGTQNKSPDVNISLEPYLSMKNDEQRILLSKLRISNHNLEIERGRHRGLQAKERICKLCLKEVEDEFHFLLKCEVLQNVRTPFIDLINNNNYNFKHLDIRE